MHQNSKDESEIARVNAPFEVEETENKIGGKPKKFKLIFLLGVAFSVMTKYCSIYLSNFSGGYRLGATTFSLMPLSITTLIRTTLRVITPCLASLGITTLDVTY